MMNVLQIQDKLKNFSQEQLIGEMQSPSGNAPQFLVLSEITRRQKMVNDDKIRQAKQNEMTVAQEAVAAAGVPQDGVAGMARAMAPKTDIAQNTGVMSQAPQAPPQAPPAPDQGGIMGMANGGYVKKMALGGSVEPRPPAGVGRGGTSARDNGIRLYGQTHNPDGTPKGTSPNMAPMVGPRPSAAVGRGGIRAAQAWDQEFGETHNPDGSPKGVGNPMKPPKDYQPMGVPPREVSTMDQDPSQVIDEMIKCNKGYILNKVNPKDSKTWVCIPDPNYKPEGDDPVAPTVTSGGGGGSSNEYLKALKDMMADNEKSAKQDKWMALAQMGLGLMQGGSGSFLGDVGAAGLPAIQSYKDSRDSASKRKLGLLGAVEDSRLADARIAASASRASSAGSPKSGDIDKYVDNLSKQIANIDKKLEDTMGLLSEEEKKELLRQRSEYQFQYNQALTNQGALYGNFTDVTE
jgi:hypothetical protein